VKTTRACSALRKYHAEGIDKLVYGLHERALQLTDELRAADFEILNNVVLYQVIVLPANNDAEIGKILAAIQDSGGCWVAGSVWQGKKVIRISVCSWVTSSDDVSRSVQAFIAARDAISQI